jgi:hypothetical protein
VKPLSSALRPALMIQPVDQEWIQSYSMNLCLPHWLCRVARRLFTGTPPLLLSYLRNHWRSRVKPLMRPRLASQRRTMKREFPADPPNLNLPALEFSLANTANPVIIE